MVCEVAPFFYYEFLSYKTESFVCLKFEFIDLILQRPNKAIIAFIINTTPIAIAHETNINANFDILRFFLAFSIVPVV